MSVKRVSLIITEAYEQLGALEPATGCPRKAASIRRSGWSTPGSDQVPSDSATAGSTSPANSGSMSAGSSSAGFGFGFGFRFDPLCVDFGLTGHFVATQRPSGSPARAIRGPTTAMIST